MLDNSLLRKRIEEMVGRQLTAKGLRQVGVEDPSDLLVYFFVDVKDKQRVESTGMAGGPYGVMYGRGPGYYGGGMYGRGPGYYGGGMYGRGPGYYGGGVTTYEYEEGTLIVDLAESSKKELVWRATIVAILRGSPEENLELVNKGVAKAFEAYPPAKKK